MSKANETQVGGSHYRNEYQHWDLVVDLGLGYYEGQVTKYVTRHTKKNGLQDLQKASHFLDKLMELVAQGRIHPPGEPVTLWQDIMRRLGLRRTDGNWTTVRSRRLFQYSRANRLGTFEDFVVCMVAQWETIGDLRQARRVLRTLTDTAYVDTQGPRTVIQHDEDPEEVEITQVHDLHRRFKNVRTGVVREEPMEARLQWKDPTP